MILDPIKLSQDLIRFPSVSGEKSEIIDFFKKTVDKLGFKSQIMNFEGDGGTYPVSNVHSIYNPGNSKNILYFAGHLDVVPTGKESAWQNPPFSATIKDGTLFGRGACDMKCAIACFVSAVSEFLVENENFNFGIGLLITGDEEAESINGTKKMLSAMKSAGQTMSNCIIGEPTSSKKLGDVAKIGRRGSVSFNLKIQGQQGHVAYPENAINPITPLNNIMKVLKDHRLDMGNEFFDPSNLEFTSVYSPNTGGNVIPDYAQVNFNIRFNNSHSGEDLVKWVEYICSKGTINGDYELKHSISGESFITKPGLLSKITSKAIQEVVGISPELSTTGGTSDARFIKDYCPTIEIGMLNKTAHHINENVEVLDVQNLKEIYKKILELYE